MWYNIHMERIDDYWKISHRKGAISMMTEQEEKRMRVAINSSIALLEAWKKGDNIITLDKQEPLEHKYILNNYLSVIESNLLEAITPVTDMVVRKDGKYEISRTI